MHFDIYKIQLSTNKLHGQSENTKYKALSIESSEKVLDSGENPFRMRIE